VHIGISIQFTSGRTPLEKEVQVWIYPANGTDVLSPVQLLNDIVSVPDFATSNTAEMYVSKCMSNLMDMFQTKVFLNGGLSSEKLMLALGERKID